MESVYSQCFEYNTYIENRAKLHSIAKHTQSFHDLQFICTVRVYRNHFKMVRGCRIDTGSCKKALSKILFSKNTCNKGGIHRWAKGKTGIGLDEHRTTHT